jgi:hypothetical protein
VLAYECGGGPWVGAVRGPQVAEELHGRLRRRPHPSKTISEMEILGEILVSACFLSKRRLLLVVVCSDLAALLCLP